MINDINQVSQLADLYRNKPGELQKRYQVSKNLIDLLALQKIKSEKEQAARQMQMQMQNSPATIKQQREQEVLDLTRNQMVNAARSTMAQKEAERRKRMERMAGIAGQANRPMNFRGGGIVSFNGGGDITEKDIAAWRRDNPERAANMDDFQIERLLSMQNMRGNFGGIGELLRSALQLERRGYGKPKAESQPQQSAGNEDDIGVIDGMTGADDATGERPPIEPVATTEKQKWVDMPPPAAEQQEDASAGPGTEITGRPVPELEDVTINKAEPVIVNDNDEIVETLTRGMNTEFDPMAAAEEERGRTSDVYGTADYREQRAADRTRYTDKLADAEAAQNSRSGIWNMLANMGGYGYLSNAARSGVAALNETKEAQRNRISAAEKALRDFDATTEAGVMSRIDKSEAAGRDLRNYVADREAANDALLVNAANINASDRDHALARRSYNQSYNNAVATLKNANNVEELKNAVQLYKADQAQALQEAIQKDTTTQRLLALDAEVLGVITALTGPQSQRQVMLNSGKMDPDDAALMRQELNNTIEEYQKIRRTIRQRVNSDTGIDMPDRGSISVPEMNADLLGG